MSTPDGRYWITFNGEIYNYQALKRELESTGIRFSTGTDTEVILRLFERDGTECVRKLDGMFAFGIWDECTQTAFLARDPFGIKPLYYSTQDGTLTFASEVSAILKSAPSRPKLCLEALTGYLMTGSVPEPWTMVEHIRCLPVGHYLLWHDGNSSLHCYWQPTFGDNSCTWNEAVDLVRTALIETVNRHLVSDVPVGLFLSGGIDSTVLLALAKIAEHKDLRTYTLGFDAPHPSEAEVARRTATHFGSPLSEWRLTAEVARPVLAEYVGAMDQPSIDGFNTFSVSRYARSMGAKVVLSGLGGDELFAGYQTFSQVRGIYKTAEIIPNGVRQAGARSLERWGGLRVRRLGACLQFPPDWGTAHWCVRGIFTPHEALSLASNYVSGRPLPSTAELMSRLSQKATREIPPADQVSHLEITRYMKNQLLRDADVFSMAWGLELRVPFVDRRFFDTIASIPSRHRLASGKKLLRAAVPEIPEWVLYRSKQGFVLPFNEWSKKEWKDQFDYLDRSSPIPLGTWYRRWSLFALDHFLSRHGIGTAPN